MTYKNYLKNHVRTKEKLDIKKPYYQRKNKENHEKLHVAIILLSGMKFSKNITFKNYLRSRTRDLHPNFRLIYVFVTRMK